MLKSFYSLRNCSLISVVVVGSLFCTQPWAFAQETGILEGETREQPKERTTAVTATVADYEAPSTPILISPADDSTLTINKPTLVWQGSTDNIQVSHYDLFVNGTARYTYLPITSTTTSQYTLTYNPSTHNYSLVFLSALSEGSHIWRIEAIDTSGNRASSVSWDFSVDTTAPKFAITHIDDQELGTHLTTENAASVPSEPIELKNNTPDLRGTGEAQSKVRLIITYEDQSTDQQEFVIDASGNWSITLDTLPRDQIIELDFQITDRSGNVSVLANVLLILRTPKVVIPLPALPPRRPVVPPGLPSPQPQIEIPILPPLEYLPPALQEIPEVVVFYVNSYSASVREFYASSLDKLWLVSVAVLLSLLPLIKLSMLSVYFRHYLSLHLFRQMLWVIGIPSRQPPQGIAVEAHSQVPISFGLIHYSGKNSQAKPIKIACITNALGIYLRPQLGEGVYRASLLHSQYFFPVLSKRPAHLEWNMYYTGQEITVDKTGKQPLLVYPAERIQQSQNVGLERFRSSILLLPSLNIPLATLALFITLAYPGYINWISLGTYLTLYAYKQINRRRDHVDVYVANTAGEPRSRVIVATRPKQAETYDDITQTDDFGLAHLHLPTTDVQVHVLDFKQTLTEGDNKTTACIKHDVSDKYWPFILR